MRKIIVVLVAGLAALLFGTGCPSGELVPQDVGGGDTVGGDGFGGDSTGTDDTGRPPSDTGLDAGPADGSDDTDGPGDVGDATTDADGSDGDAGGSCPGNATRECGTSVGVCEKGTQTCTNGSWSSCQGATNSSPEACDGKDNDCDGTVDENCNCTSGETRECGTSTGVCEKGTQSCTNGSWGTCQGATNSSPETCDGKDNDCDGTVDDPWAGDLGTSCTAGSGVCATRGTVECQANGSGTTCSASPGSPTESPETSCDGKDNDCDGTVDENITRSCGNATGVCQKGTETCNNGVWSSCQGDTSGSSESCDGKDNDCDGTVDDPWTGDLGDRCTVGTGVCEASGTVECRGDGSGTTCSASAGSPPESPEQSCDGKDNDCDGNIDEGCDSDGDGYCKDSRPTSGSPSVCPKGGGDCDDSDADIYPGAPGKCDGKDNDCDGNIDEIEPVTSTSQSTTHNASRDASLSSKIKTAVSTPTDEGVCAAYLHNDGSIQFAHVKSNGNVVRRSHSMSGKDPKELFDIAWSGNSCALILRRKVSFTPDDDLYLARWNPAVPSTFEHVQLTTNTYNSEYEGHAAVEFVSGVGWVTTFVETTLGLDNVHFATIDEYFYNGSDTPNQTKLTEVDVAASGPWPTLSIGASPASGDDYAIAITSRWNNNYQVRVYTVDGTNTTHRSNLDAGYSPGDEWKHVQLDEVDGDHLLSFHDNNPGIHRFWEIEQASGSGLTYTQKGWANSGSRTQIFPTNLTGGTSRLGHWFIDPYTDKPMTFDPSGGGVTNFTRYSHPDIASSDDLRTLYPDGSDDTMYVFSITDKSPYKSELNGFTCY